MSEVLLIRHAETDMAGTFCGHSDPELNARGCAQLAELIDRLRAENFGVMYASDLRRASATGTAIATTFGVDCRIRSALREVDFGQWEGITWEEIERRDEAYARRWIAEKGYDPRMGARPMARTIQEHIKRPLAEELLFGRLVGGGSVRVSVAKDGTKLELECIPTQLPEVTV